MAVVKLRKFWQYSGKNFIRCRLPPVSSKIFASETSNTFPPYLLRKILVAIIDSHENVRRLHYSWIQHGESLALKTLNFPLKSNQEIIKPC